LDVKTRRTHFKPPSSKHALHVRFCTPGLPPCAGIALLTENPNPTEDDVRHGMSGNLCRCGAYPKILRAVLATANTGDANG
jgi:carbon-monoxide dehydrogenase small subunit